MFYFGFILSDVQVLLDGLFVVVFLWFDCGVIFMDYYMLVLVQGFVVFYSYLVFELVDVDVVGIGQCVLSEKGWMYVWGMGCYIFGSQVFDYWQDFWGDKYEYYCDGDMFMVDVVMGIYEVSCEVMLQWGLWMLCSFIKLKIIVVSIVLFI